MKSLNFNQKMIQYISHKYATLITMFFILINVKFIYK